MSQAVACGAGDHLGWFISLLVVDFLSLVPLLLAIGFAGWRTLRHARTAKRYSDLTKRGSSAGVVRALRGTIELDASVPFAARVEVQQQSKTWQSKRSTFHEWRETGRSVSVSPFQVRLQDGVLARVEANQKALLCIPFEGRPTNSDDRTLVAQLVHGQEVTVVGRVFERSRGASSAYRDSPLPQVLVRAPVGRRLVISTRSVVEAFRKRMFLHLKWLAIALVTTGFVHGLLAMPFHIREIWGEQDEVVVMRKRTYRSKSTTYYIETRTEEGGFLPEESASKDCYTKAGVGDRVTALIVPGHSWAMQLGTKPTANYLVVLAAAAASLTVLGLYRRELRTNGPWYLRKRVDMRGAGAPLPSDLPEA